MLQHASLEVRPDQVDACIAFWGLLGFAPMQAPPRLGGRFSWVERNGTQIHLIPTDDPVQARAGHVAVLAEDFDAAIAALRGAGFDPQPTIEAWDTPRSFVRDPAGHLVEVMATVPEPPFPPADD